MAIEEVLALQLVGRSQEVGGGSGPLIAARHDVAHAGRHAIKRR
jgi:hypothetical protein